MYITLVWIILFFGWTLFWYLYFHLYASDSSQDGEWVVTNDFENEDIIEDQVSYEQNWDISSQIETSEVLETISDIEEEILPTEETQLQELPESVNLDVTFYSQAPDGDWSLPWKEACEEASIIQAYYYVQERELSKELFKQEILTMVELENDILGKNIDTSVAETAKVLQSYYDYIDFEIVDNPSIDDLKQTLAEWHPIVAPFAGRELGNIYYSNGGPRYHMLVITGYDENVFFTNDVGTSRGKNYSYSHDTIMNALHDLVPEGEWNIEDGEKRVLILK